MRILKARYVKLLHAYKKGEQILSKHNKPNFYNLVSITSLPAFVGKKSRMKSSTAEGSLKRSVLNNPEKQVLMQAPPLDYRKVSRKITKTLLCKRMTGLK